jgi:hypothetical protein
MSQKSGNNVTPPVKDKPDASGEIPTNRDNLAEQHHGESTKTLQDDKRIGQHQGAGRPPLMKK